MLKTVNRPAKLSNVERFELKRANNVRLEEKLRQLRNKYPHQKFLLLERFLNRDFVLPQYKNQKWFDYAERLEKHKSLYPDHHQKLNDIINHDEYIYPLD